MVNVTISDGVMSYHALVPAQWNASPNFHELKKSFARGYDSGDCEDCVPFECVIGGDFEGSFLLHCNGRGGTLEGDDCPAYYPLPVQWDG